MVCSRGKICRYTKTPQGTPVVDKEYLKPPQKVLRRNKVVSGGNISSKEWIAQYKGQPQFLGERRYAKIDPLKGTFYPDKQTSEGSKKYSSSQQSKWVIMDVPSDNQKELLPWFPGIFDCQCQYAK